MAKEFEQDNVNEEVLTIEPDPQGGRIVRVGDRYAELCTDECLWAVAEWLMGSKCNWLQTKEQHEEQLRRWRESSIDVAEIWEEVTT